MATPRSAREGRAFVAAARSTGILYSHCASAKAGNYLAEIDSCWRGSKALSFEDDLEEPNAYFGAGGGRDGYRYRVPVT